ncbi:MAG: hypothetical protein J6A44_03355 [Paludibacteraceae bacterium]|nr:hypothetical protein [Paludibacteraceae bacterium]
MNDSSDNKQYKAMYKCELARAAGVSLTTLRQWCQENHSQLCDYGYHPNDKLLSPGAVKFLCEKYVIEVKQ